jgi:drug/metabolite transporter (DMT)-like permease
MFAASGSKLRQWDRLFPALALLNITGEITSQLCIATAGSGTYIVIYSSMTVFTVIFRKIFLNKSVTWAMLSGILIIMAGLAVTVKGIKGEGGGSMVLGVFSGFVSALLYAGYYVMGEAVLCVPLTASTALVSPWSLGAFEGYTFTILYLPYAVFLLFNGKWDSLVAQPMADAQADGSTVGFCYLVLILTNGLHMVALLKLLRHTDAIVAGVNKAVQVCIQ